MYEDRVLVYADCGKKFTQAAGEQEFYVGKGFTNEPERYKEYRLVRKDTGEQHPPHQVHGTVCTACDEPYKVSSQPSGERPVYCSGCFAKIKAGAIV